MILKACTIALLLVACGVSLAAVLTTVYDGDWPMAVLFCSFLVGLTRGLDETMNV